MSTNSPSPMPPRLKFQTTLQGDERTIKCVGQLTIEVSNGFKNEMREILPQTRRLILDLSELAYMDSSGLGAVVSVYVSAKKLGCELRLVHLNKQVAKLLGITRVISFFEDCGKSPVRLP
jgi:anti-sigma B factor antagonist